jgi:hypothetical protein
MEFALVGKGFGEDGNVGDGKEIKLHQKNIFMGLAIALLICG